MIINNKFILRVMVVFSLVTFNDVRGSHDITGAPAEVADAQEPARKFTHAWTITAGNHSEHMFI